MRTLYRLQRIPSDINPQPGTMTKHQLRIGNKVKVFGKIYTIKELGEYEAAMEETHGVFVYSDVQGVELTGEVLQACGFPGIKQNDGSFDYFMLPEGSTGISSWVEFRRDGVLSFNYGGFVQGLEVTHLHQIQNLYMDCAGAELTINIERSKV